MLRKWAWWVCKGKHWCLSGGEINFSHFMTGSSSASRSRHPSAESQSYFLGRLHLRDGFQVFEKTVLGGRRFTSQRGTGRMQPLKVTAPKRGFSGVLTGTNSKFSWAFSRRHYKGGGAWQVDTIICVESL